MRHISICIPTYNRVALTIESFIDVYTDERVSEIVIVDDASEPGVWEELIDICKHLDKVSLCCNEKNLDCYRNKREAVSKATNEWVILLDSDNVIDKSYIDKLFEQKLDEKTIYTPSFAKPNFDFRMYEGNILSKENIASFIDRPMLEVCLNACNYFINRNEYLRIWDGSVDPVTSDSIYFMSKWFEAGNKLNIVAGLHYNHTMHYGHYEQNKNRTPQGFHENILNKLRVMS
jgi:glycosyltransferase involved in cell wall biosynthesis